MVRMHRALAAGLVIMLMPPAARAAACADLLPQAVAAAPRALVPEDLVRLRDIGPVDPFGAEAPPFTLSPDGERVAFQLRRADPASNGYCLGMVVLDLAGGAGPRLVDTGGAFLRSRYDFRGKAGFPTGIARTITPRWSPDGHWIAFLKRAGEVTQVWRAAADGSGSRPVTASETDVEDFRLSEDGRTLIFSSRPALMAARAAIEREGLSGFHYDDRFAPAASGRPFPPAPVPRAVFVQDLATGLVRAASDEEAELLPTSSVGEVAWSEASGPDGRRAWLADPSPIYPGRGRLTAENAQGTPITCTAEACAVVSLPWWTSEGRVRFIRREGWAEASTATYEWAPGPGAPQRLFVTDDVPVACVPQGDALLCLIESSLVPRRLERLDPASGERQVLFDPNPEFAQLALGRPQRLHLKNRFGLESVADLVFPVGYRASRRYPLIVVQYNTRGFLRGGTGDDYPIQAFANRGYAVLSVSRPKAIGFLSGSSDFVEVDRLNLEGFADRRSVLDSLEAGVAQAIDNGIADPARIGITGMSDGASTAGFALLHSDLFAAAAVSHCCFDTSLAYRVGPGAAREFYRMGYPKLTDTSAAAQEFWEQIAFSRNAHRIRTPLLLQLSDDEYLSALESYTALREVAAPIDMFAFPQEHHVKWQPAHRLAVYRRSLDWFDYWLKDRRSAAPERQAELRHWDRLRRELAARPAP